MRHVNSLLEVGRHSRKALVVAAAGNDRVTVNFAHISQSLLHLLSNNECVLVLDILHSFDVKVRLNVVLDLHLRFALMMLVMEVNRGGDIMRQVHEEAEVIVTVG